MYERSLTVEPREREDEKIARYYKTFLLPSLQGLRVFAVRDEQNSFDTSIVGF